MPDLPASVIPWSAVKTNAVRESRKCDSTNRTTRSMPLSTAKRLSSKSLSILTTTTSIMFCCLCFVLQKRRLLRIGFVDMASGVQTKQMQKYHCPIVGHLTGLSRVGQEAFEFIENPSVQVDGARFAREIFIQTTVRIGVNVMGCVGFGENRENIRTTPGVGDLDRWMRK